MDFSTEDITKEKEGRWISDCRTRGRGGLYLGGWSAIHGYPNATVTDGEVCHGGECFTEDELIAAEALLGLHEGPISSIRIAAETPLVLNDGEVCHFTEDELIAAEALLGLHEGPISCMVLQSELSVEIMCRPKKKVKKSLSPLLDPILPVDFKARIRELTGGSQDEEEVKFVYEKDLFKSDVTQQKNRLLIPVKQIKKEFLTEEEKQELGRRLSGGKRCEKIEVKLIQPSLEMCTINLKKWDMSDKSTGKLNENYVLVTTWHKVVKENELKEGTTVQLWSFRTNGKLCFALVKKGQ